MLDTGCNQAVYLVKDLEELSLSRGAVGIVRSTWEYPNAAYEVEFETAGCTLRLLLLPGQVISCEESLQASP